MAIPPFLAELRSFVGTRPLWLSGVAAVVLDDRGRLLLARRADNGRWSIIGGILDPGEQPADGVARECFEETGVTVEPEKLTSVTVSPMLHYPNGDQAQYLDLTFRCRLVSGEARVNDDESLEVGWFELDALPELDAYTRERLELALVAKPETVFLFSGPVADPV
ncbi:NUDIX domain-containing protein [Kitasatospora atroaurantiaca]|uniref:ADP-ribose pyrophosphatase YjhB (NUDIX family) n=1 Tax=Kitasatospora atroaurantiaca TaxID=285545 RepID=A0A561EKB5_9ACTN|nr:NUDIX domain-containing protein [Kitasatospora atroaurantiaca]TWE16054.1 ADP-ribose pyrophosphatase YjhB (NUDIX family) [Kitasatospora atroaurantiaca]